MFCTQCGNEIEEHARFCSRCGYDLGARSPALQQPRTAHDMNLHITILGWLLIGSGVLTAMFAFILLFGGQFIRHLPLDMARDMPPGMPPFLASIMSVIGLGVLALGAGTTAAGVGLLQYRSWARVFAIIMAVFLVFHFPIGTAIAIYGFWVLLSQEGQEYYKSRSESTITPSGA
jgi:hypothetical protein